MSNEKTPTDEQVTTGTPDVVVEGVETVEEIDDTDIFALPLDKGWLIEVLSQQSSRTDDTAMRFYLDAQVKELGLTPLYDEFGNLYVVKGAEEKPDDTPYPCVVCHTDTVHTIRDKFRVIESNGVLWGMDMYNVRMSGVGGDDKVGVYITLEMLRTLPYCKAVFFRFEESGCRGSSAAHMGFFEDVCFVLQADRKGFTDFIDFSNGCKIFSEEFHEAVKPLLDVYKYKRTGGLGTDVGQLKQKGLAVCGVNLSCGYYNPHTEAEYVVIEDVEACLNLMYDLFMEFGDKVWPHINPPKPVYPSYVEKYRKPSDTESDGKNASSVARSGYGTDRFDGQRWRGRTVTHFDYENKELWYPGHYDDDENDAASHMGATETDTQDKELRYLSWDGSCFECGDSPDNLHFHDFGYWCRRCLCFYSYEGDRYTTADYDKYPTMQELRRKYILVSGNITEGEYREVDERLENSISLLLLKPGTRAN